MKTTAAVATILCAGAAHAAFVNAEIRVEEALSAQASAAAGTDLTVTRLYFRFDEADDILNRIGNVQLSTAFAAEGATLFQETLFGNPVNTSAQQNAGAWGAIPTLEFDSYVGIGGPDDNFGSGSDTLDPDFAFTSDGVVGGWFDIPGMDGSRQGLAGDGDMVEGLWEVFGGQFTINGDFTDSARSPDARSGALFLTELFRGTLDIGWIDQAGGPEIVEAGLVFLPAPGAAALFGVAGLAATRRRR